MPGPIPVFLGGQTPFHAPLDDIHGNERDLASLIGEGVYDLENNEEKDHYKFRITIATGFAILDASDWRVWLNTLPTKAIALLADWEDILGLSPAPEAWDLEQRWDRIRARAIEYRGADPDTISLAVWVLFQRYVYGYTYEQVLSLLKTWTSSQFDGFIVSETDIETVQMNRNVDNGKPSTFSITKYPTHELNRYEVAIMLNDDSSSVSMFNNTALWRELQLLRDRIAPCGVHIALNCTTAYNASGYKPNIYISSRRPRWNWGSSRWGRDCWGTKAYSDGNYTLPYDPNGNQTGEYWTV